jgi:hypothetical protein
MNKKQEVDLGSKSAITTHRMIMIQTLGRKVKNWRSNVTFA